MTCGDKLGFKQPIAALSQGVKQPIEAISQGIKQPIAARSQRVKQLIAAISQGVIRVRARLRTDARGSTLSACWLAEKDGFYYYCHYYCYGYTLRRLA